MEKFQEFDSPVATEFVAARQNFTESLLKDFRDKIQVSSVVDVGCGVGYFSKFLHDLGFQVTGIDGREKNVEECKRRYPGIPFRQGNAEDLSPEQFGTFDLVLCFGLLYHLENPFRAIRSLYSIAGQVLLVESVCAPGPNPSMDLLDEYKLVNQSLSYVAFYPTESCLIKMLYRAGFPFVYRFTSMPAHEDFHATRQYKQRRTMLLASRSSVEASQIRLVPEPMRTWGWDIWKTRYQRMVERAGQITNGARGRLKRILGVLSRNGSRS